MNLNPTPFDILVFVIGVAILIGLAIRPAFWWNRGRMKFTRERIGDRNTFIIYFVLAVVMVAVAIWGASQG